MLTIIRFALTLLIILVNLTPVGAQECTETPRGQIESALDKSTNRILLRDVVDSFGDEGNQILAHIAGDPSQPPKRRGNAISLLGEHRSEAGKKLLLEMLGEYPARCSAINPIQEYRDPQLVPRFIALLDDRRSCGNVVRFSIGGNGEEKKTEFFVSDEAVGALERMTGVRLEKETDLFLIGHRATQPWKDWWDAHRVKFLTNPVRFMAPQRNDEQQDNGYPCSVQAIAVSPDGKMAFSSGKSYDPWVRAWDIEKRKQIWATPTAQDEDVTSAALSPSGRVVAMGTTNGAVEVFDAGSGHRLRMLIVGNGVESVAFSPHNHVLAAGLDDGKIHLFDTRNWCETKEFDSSDMTEQVAFSPDDSLLAAATFEKVILWSVTDGKQLMKFGVRPGKPPKVFVDAGERRAQLWRMAWRVAFSPDGKLLATGSSGAVQLWNPATGEVIKSTPSRGQIGSLYFSPDGKWIVWGNDHDKIIKWDISTGEILKFKNEFSLGDTAMTSNGKLILSPGAGTEIAIFDFDSRQRVGVLTCTKHRQ